MVDYKKLYLKLFNEITKTIDSLEKVREEAFNEFAKSNPSKEDTKDFVSNMELKSSSNCKSN